MNNLKVVIVEDEKLAANNLEKQILSIDADIEVLVKLTSVKSAVEWFTRNSADLIFMDIQLGDGKSFTIFERVTINVPVIFTTAYDQYAIKAFKANGIAYLLKPIDVGELREAISRYRNFTRPVNDLSQISEIFNRLNSQKTEYKQRFMIQAGSRIKSVPVKDIAYFFFVERAVFLCANSGKHYPVEYSLDKLEELIDPDLFFRINRKMIVSIDAISQMVTLSKSRIMLKLDPAYNEEVLVSFNKTPDFRKWLDR